MAESTEPEGAVGDVVSAFHEEEDHGDGVGDVEEDDASGYHAVESSGRSDVQQTQDSNNDTAHCVRIERYPHLGVHLDPVSRAGKTTVTCEGPAQTSLPCVAGNLASKTGKADKELHESGTWDGSGGLVVKLQDRCQCRCVYELVKIRHREEHGDGVDERGDESNCNSSYDCEGNVPLRMRYFFS